MHSNVMNMAILLRTPLGVRQPSGWAGYVQGSVNRLAACFKWVALCLKLFLTLVF